MPFKIAWRNITSKPWRTLATVLAVALAVAMVFCMFSFKQAVYEYILATETADAGRSDIIVAKNSSSDRITGDDPLYSVDGIETVCPTLSLYAMLDGEYVKVRGFEASKIDALQTIKPVGGDVELLKRQPDSIAISAAAARKFNLDVGSPVTLELGPSKATFYVAVVAETDGYFLSDSPFVFIGTCADGIARLLGFSYAVYNEIYITAQPDADIDALIETISEIPEYSKMKVDVSKDAAYIEEQTTGLTAPIVLAGAAVLLLMIACVALLFILGEKDKLSMISRLSVVGATKKQLIGIFLIESLIISVIGAVLGTAVASGIFIALLKFTLSSTVSFSVSALKLFGAAAAGIAVAILASVYPLIRAFKGSVRDNQLDKERNTVFKTAFPIALILVTAVSVTIEFCVGGAKGALSVVNVLLALVCAGVCVPYILKGAARLSLKAANPCVKTAALGLRREKRHTRSLTLLTVGTAVGVMLFMAYSLTTNIFDSYIEDFSNMAFVTNVQSDVDTDEFGQIEGVDGATKLVWRTGQLEGASFDKTMNVLGSIDTLDMVEFGYVTPRNIIQERLNSGLPYVVLDIALSELYGVGEGDSVSLTMDGISREFEVAGIVSHRLFSGNYVILSSDLIEDLYDIRIDTVLVVTNGDISEVVGKLRESFASRNYYVVEALEAYRWERQSMGAVFDLVGTLAVIVTIFIFLVTVAGVVVGRSTAERDRMTLLAAGMSKNMLLGTELYEHSLIAVISYICAFTVSVLMTACLINALRLFGLYFEFMYEAWVVALVGAVVCLCFAILPLVLNYKKRYNMRKV